MNEYTIARSRALEPLFFRAPCPPQLTPRQYQLAGVEFALARPHCLIGDAPGVGKTAQAILISNALGARRTLVVCPASLRKNWVEEIERWSTVPNVRVSEISKGTKGVSLEHDYVVISYDLLRNPGIMAALEKVEWPHVVLDEAHAIKDPGAQRTRVIMDLVPKIAKRITLLTGTPMPNGPRECLGADTLVLTKRGWQPIIAVAATDLIWDGVEWVSHGGLIYQGNKSTLKLGCVSVTAEHNVNVSNSWHAAASLVRNKTLTAQALETGSANLPSSVWREVRAAGSWPLLFNALAATSPLQPTSLICATDALASADHVGLKSELRSTHMSRFVPMPPCEHVCSAGEKTSCSDATTRAPSALRITGAVGSPCMSPGNGPVAISWPIFSRSPGTPMPGFSWTALTTTSAINPATFDLQRARSIWETVAQSLLWSLKSPNWKPVYDLMNAGPRQRFTILTDQGPLIVHNCYTACRLLCWEAIENMSLHHFEEKYYGEGGGFIFGMHWDEKKQANVREKHWSEHVRNVPRNLEDLQARMRGNFMIRRLKADVLPQLPPKQFHLVPLALTPELKAALNHPGWGIAKQLMDLDPEAFAGHAGVDGAVATARRLLGEAKAIPACEYIEELLREGVRKIVVSAHHTTVLVMARVRLGKQGLVFMDGRTPMGQRQSLVHQFQTDPTIKIILGQTAVMGLGFTLTEAQDIVLLEASWVPGDIEQVVDRIHRIGQAGAYVQAHIPVVPGSLDERILSTVVGKARDINLALDA